MGTVTGRSGRRTKVATAIIDCDIHPLPRDESVLDAYLPVRWREYRRDFGLRTFGKGIYPRHIPNACRVDAWPPGGGLPGSDLGFMREQLLDRWDLEGGILNATTASGRIMNLDFGVAFAHAINDWIADEWLDKEPRLRASIETAYEDPLRTAEEIRLRADDGRFVQVGLFSRASEPFGRRRYWPIYDAAQECGLPIGMHVGSQGGHPTTGVGYPSYYIEDHAGMIAAYQDQVTSLVFEGVFHEFPELQFVLIEGGFAWLAPLTWRMDRAWEKYRAEVPHVDRPPSEIVREHIWFTTQPMEEPPKPSDFETLLEELDMDEHVMFATDYPHWDFDSPDTAFPIRLGEEREIKFMHANAESLYSFHRPVFPVSSAPERTDPSDETADA